MHAHPGEQAVEPELELSISIQILRIDDAPVERGVAAARRSGVQHASSA